jgi:chemotaxis methyl-accepting protein methylase
MSSLQLIFKDKLDQDISYLLETVHQKYGYDFRQYSQAHVSRRIMNKMRLSGLADVSQMQNKVVRYKFSKGTRQVQLIILLNSFLQNCKYRT